MKSRRNGFCLFAGIILLSLACPAQVPDDARWDSGFGLPGVQGTVAAMAFDKKHIYIGGMLQSVGDLVPDAVAEFDGKRWHALRDGPEFSSLFSYIYALEMFKGRLYAAGSFATVSGQPSGGFACWHGNKWYVPGVTGGVVRALCANEQGLLVAGAFSLSGRTGAVALARFDGHKTWQVLDSEMLSQGAYVTALTTLPNGDIVGLLASYRDMLFRCDRNNNWFNMPGPDGHPDGVGRYVLTTFAGHLIAGGTFTNAVTPSIRNVAWWDGTSWQPLGESLEGEVISVAGNERALYAWHQVGMDGRVGTFGISRWNGTQWARLDTNIFRAIPIWGKLFIGPKDELYAAGMFTGIGSVVAPGLVRWNGSSWESLFSGAYEGIAGLATRVTCLLEHQGSVYASGLFLSAGSVFAQGIARWDGAHWRDLGGGITGQPNGSFRALASSGDLLFAGGSFTNIGGVAANRVASWNGAAWSPLGTGVRGNVNALAWYNGALYMGGRFQEAGGVAATNIGRWDGAAWQPVGGGCHGTVNSLAVWAGKLYVGGAFDQAGAVPALHLASWDGAQWQDEGIGVWGMETSSVTKVAAGPDGLYVAIRFYQAGFITAFNILRWDGTTWQALGEGWQGSLSAMAWHGDSLFIGGRWLENISATAPAILRWNGAGWSELGSGVQAPLPGPQVSALLSTPEGIWVGGRFTYAGGKPSANIARWR